MSDLVERLRNPGDLPGAWRLCKEAANRIEELEQALRAVVEATPANQHQKWPHHHFYLTTAQRALSGATND